MLCSSFFHINTIICVRLFKSTKTKTSKFNQLRNIMQYWFTTAPICKRFINDVLLKVCNHCFKKWSLYLICFILLICMVVNFHRCGTRIWKGGVNPYTPPKSIFFYFYLENNIAFFLGVFDLVKGCFM